MSRFIADAERHFELTAFLRFSPIMPVARRTPPYSLRLMWCERGHAQVTLKDRCDVLSREQMLLINAQTEVRVQAAQEDTVIGEIDISFLPGSDALGLSRQLPLCDPAYARLCTRDFDILPFQDAFGIVGCMIDLLRRFVRPPSAESAAALHGELCLSTLLLAVSNAVLDSGAYMVSNPHVAHAIQFIKEHFMEEINVSAIAADAHLHPNYLHRLFSAEMGYSVGSYLLQYRLESARSMLIGTKATIEDIARACGIANCQHFSKLFRQKYGMPPSAYRRKFNITSNYVQARAQFGVIDYAVPSFSRPFHERIHTLSDPIYRQRGFVPVIKAYYSRADMLESTTDKTDHIHPLFEIMYVREGMITVVLEGKTVHVREGQYIWINAGVQHKLELCADTPSSVVNIEYMFVEEPLPVATTCQLCAVSPAYRDMLENAPRFTVLNDPFNTMGLLLHQTVLTADSGSPRCEALCSSLTQQCMLLIAAQQHAARPGVPARFHANPAEEAVLERLTQMACAPVTVGELAKACRMRPARLQQLVRHATGLSVTGYIQHARIEKAKALLLNGLSVADCAEQTGFSSDRYFSQLFKRIVGVTPSAFCAHTLHNENDHKEASP